MELDIFGGGGGNRPVASTAGPLVRVDMTCGNGGQSLFKLKINFCKIYEGWTRQN